MRLLLKIVAALLSLLLLAYAVLHSAGFVFPPAFERLDPAAAAVAGLILANLYLLICSGYRRLPFWLLLASGDLLFFFPMIVPVQGFLLDGALICASAFLLITARWIASRPMRPFGRMIPSTMILTAGVLLSTQVLFAHFAPGKKAIDTGSQIEKIMNGLSPAAEEYRNEIETYLYQLTENEIGETEKKLIDELNRRIRILEADRDRFEQLREENLDYREEIVRLEQRLKDLPVSDLDEDDFLRVADYREAVRPEVPLVRDFAVKLASSVPGSYYVSPGSSYPGEVGIRQVLAIHRYLSGSWKYVNDPIILEKDFFSPADRTIALGLSGDCDDFAVLMASCVEAIGGRTRIVHGTCDEGAHAWCEVEVGSRSTLDLAARILLHERTDRTFSWITPSNSHDYWLSLDWEAGTCSCGYSPVIIYQSGGSS